MIARRRAFERGQRKRYFVGQKSDPIGQKRYTCFDGIDHQLGDPRSEGISYASLWLQSYRYGPIPDVDEVTWY